MEGISIAKEGNLRYLQMGMEVKIIGNYRHPILSLASLLYLHELQVAGARISG